MAVTLIVESEASPRALQALRDVVDDFGLRDVEVEASYERRSADPLPWIIEIAISAPVAAFFVELAKSAGKSAGEDAWKTFREFVDTLRRRRREAGDEAGTLILGVGPIEVPLADELPDVAFEQLQLMDDVSAPFSGLLKWENESGRWIDPLAGQIVCDAESCTNAATTEQVIQLENGLARKFWCALHSESGGADGVDGD
jgi:hypothetical protein